MLLRFELGDIVFLSAADSCPSEWDEVPEIFFKNVNVLKLPHHGQIDSISASDRRYHSANQAVYQKLAAIFPAEHPPHFLFSDEREYPPYFSQPEGFQAIKLVMDSGMVIPEFIRIQ